VAPLGPPPAVPPTGTPPAAPPPGTVPLSAAQAQQHAPPPPPAPPGDPAHAPPRSPLPPPPQAYGTSRPPYGATPTDQRLEATRPDSDPIVWNNPPPTAAPPAYGAPPPGLPPDQPQAQGGGALTGRPLHGDPVLRRMSRGIRRVVGASASLDVHDRTAAAARLQQPVTTTRRIAVTSVRGGAGKTTIATLMASAFAQHRQDRVLLIDADPEFGTMPLRLGVTSAPSMPELAGRQFASFEDARPFLTRTDAGLWILPGTGPGAPALDSGTFQAVAAALNRFFAIVVVDCGAGLTGDLQRGIMANAHAHLHVTPGTADGAVSAGRALDWLSASGYRELVARTVTVFAVHAPHSRANLGPATELLRANGIGVLNIAYDRHLASGGVLDLSLLAEGTRLTAVEIAAEVLTRARS
jgi:MinD-like ATPase involved in chromosome partitioning or flagellar assembly